MIETPIKQTHDDTDASGVGVQPQGLPLTRDDVLEFQGIIRETTGVEMNDNEAWSRANELVGVYRMLLGPIPEDPEYHR
jgi:hypothetical protein